MKAFPAWQRTLDRNRRSSEQSPPTDLKTWVQQGKDMGVLTDDLARRILESFPRGNAEE
jgi:hypothetical protein